MAAIPAMISRRLIGDASEPLYWAAYRLQGCIGTGRFCSAGQLSGFLAGLLWWTLLGVASTSSGMPPQQ